ncbi:MAG: DMT famliy transporter [Roseibaca calidilacus]|uniref:DMT famliy transporter n=1 Tax=Roseibaca calidilacus TaxID=1666912 RepID=A0A0P7WJQ6_9RHOB|nr:DMT family transporter [Roseibaca calidilacus]KPP90922.1 MAG: DMT famliy transporter [Roseibaca calidilacus]CUX83806.1 EamA-like transporter family protein [Roseibaca calidilacus]
MSDNLRGALLMTLAMAGFALEDMFIKLLSGTIPVGQILFMLGASGALVFGLFANAKGQKLFSADMASRAMIIRNIGEVVGTVGFVLGFVLASLSTASAILQATPLVVTLGAALFLGAQVGWKRWMAILAGLFGVLLIVRPGMAGFEPASLWAVIGVLGLATRDLATRAAPMRISGFQMSAWAFGLMAPTGLAMMWVMGSRAVWPEGLQLAYLACTLIIGVIAYYMVVAAMRVGDIPVVTPFRYTRMVFALFVALLVFGERPDTLTYIGAAIIVAAGLFTLWRETRRPSLGRARQV